MGDPERCPRAGTARVLLEMCLFADFYPKKKGRWGCGRGVGGDGRVGMGRMRMVRVGMKGTKMMGMAMMMGMRIG